MRRRELASPFAKVGASATGGGTGASSMPGTFVEPSRPCDVSVEAEAPSHREELSRLVLAPRLRLETRMRSRDHELYELVVHVVPARVSWAQ